MSHYIRARDPAPPTRIVIADDYELLRIGLRCVLEDEPGLTVVGEAGHGREALECCRRLQPDLMLMDVRMPVMDGMAATRALKQQCPAVRVIAMAAREDFAGLLGVLKAGAEGYVLKEAPRHEFVAGVRQLLSRETTHNGQVALGLLRELADRHPGLCVEQLTPRELDVLYLLTQGQTNREIAQGLSLSQGTVKAYVEQIIAKLRVASRTHAAVRAVELGLLRPLD